MKYIIIRSVIRFSLLKQSYVSGVFLLERDASVLEVYGF